MNELRGKRGRNDEKEKDNTNIKGEVVEDPEIIKDAHDGPISLIFTQLESIKVPALHLFQHHWILLVNPISEERKKKRKGKERKGKERKGKERKGRERISENTERKKEEKEKYFGKTERLMSTMGEQY